ncbi:VWA domain-containing protein [Thermomonas sp.]|uniref:vWA domain-containing protein n=1 Tax=Thermomonas sp. TaxID=1971895 RepID=UPI002486E530|nr:VWA domain-containing protein [Thermomonas sp.]MDI1253029.1 VWA domain-containing protein [Thermomonas sp.]
MLRSIMFGMLVCFAGSAIAAQPQDNTASGKASTNAGDTILVFDASGSMWGQIDGVPKITIARDVVQGLLKDLPPEQRLGLVAYGHRRKGDCTDIQTLVPVGTDRAAISKAIAGIDPKGMTPMTAAVEHAADELKFTEKKPLSS